MSKYIIEENINFYDELFKSLDEDTDDESTLCQITGFPLETNSVTMECNHKFNYEPLYKEICQQKFKFCSYDMRILNKKDQIKIRDSKLDYFIKCPYCRNIQFTILPYYAELGLKPKYGINSLDPDLQPKNNTVSNLIHYGDDDYTFYSYGKLFKKGQCCFETSTNICIHMYATQIENTDKSFCKYHYKTGIANLKYAERQKKIEEKIKEKLEKQAILEARQKILDEKNVERLAKGLLPLKKLPIVKKKVENIVQDALKIGEYVPEGESEIIIQKIIGCKSILKSGSNKGSQCGCQKINADGLCSRHMSKEPKNNL
jgi:hypothetical protein